MAGRPPALSVGELRRQVHALGPWFHNLHLGPVETAPDHFLGDYPAVKWNRFARALPPDLTGCSVLDIGCNAGFYSIEMKRRGAARVVGIDTDERYLAQARLAARVCEVDIELERVSVYDLPALETRFDLVLFMGVFYHLRYPLLALDLVAQHALGGTLVFQSMLRGSRRVFSTAGDYPFEHTAVFNRPGYPLMHFVEHNYAGDGTNWWIPNRACAEAMVRSAGLVVIDQPEEETFLCRLSDPEALDD